MLFFLFIFVADAAWGEPPSVKVNDALFEVNLHVFSLSPQAWGRLDCHTFRPGELAAC